SARPDREEPPDAPRFRHARRLDPLGVEPFCSLGSNLPICSVAVFSALGPPSATARRAFPFPQLTGGIHHSNQLACPSQSSRPISLQGVRRAPHSRQQVILCTWPLSFGNLASASWQKH